jgi:hypothetical protein
MERMRMERVTMERVRMKRVKLKDKDEVYLKSKIWVKILPAKVHNSAKNLPLTSSQVLQLLQSVAHLHLTISAVLQARLLQVLPTIPTPTSPHGKPPSLTS